MPFRFESLALALTGHPLRDRVLMRFRAAEALTDFSMYRAAGWLLGGSAPPSALYQRAQDEVQAGAVSSDVDSGSA